jgi:hypothetical protein
MIPQDLDQTDTAAVRNYILQWHNANKDKSAPRDWYRSWEIYLVLRCLVWVETASRGQAKV